MTYPTDTLKALFNCLPERIYNPNHQAASTDTGKAARVRSQTYSTSTSPQYATPQTPTHSTEFNIQREVAPSQQPGANQHDSDMMRMLLQPEMVVAQADNSDDVFTHFGMDMFYANHDG